MWCVSSSSLPSVSIHGVSKTDLPEVVGREGFRLSQGRTETVAAPSVEKLVG